MEARRPGDRRSQYVICRRSSFHLDVVRFEETAEVEDVFQTGYMIVSIWL
jgi:hypothetical protein